MGVLILDPWRRDVGMGVARVEVSKRSRHATLQKYRKRSRMYATRSARSGSTGVPQVSQGRVCSALEGVGGALPVMV